MDALIYGAGALGRGFLAPVFNKFGYDISFVDVNPNLVNSLNKQDSYSTVFTRNGFYNLVEVPVKAAVLFGEEQDLISSADIVLTAMGQRNLVALGDRLHSAKTVVSFENDRSSSFLLRKLSSNPNCFFGVPDVITSNTAPPALQRTYPLCVVSEEGELILEDCCSPAIPGVCGSEFEMRWACKFYLHNTPHAAAAYLGAKHSAKYIHEAMQIQAVEQTVEHVMREIKTALVKTCLVKDDLAEFYARRELARFRNSLLCDPIDRVAREPLRKLRSDDRLVIPLRLITETGGDSSSICEVIQSVIEYEGVADDNITRLIEMQGLEYILTTRCDLQEKDVVLLLDSLAQPRIAAVG